MKPILIDMYDVFLDKKKKKKKNIFDNFKLNKRTKKKSKK